MLEMLSAVGLYIDQSKGLYGILFAEMTRTLCSLTCSSISPVSLELTAELSAAHCAVVPRVGSERSQQVA